MLPPNPQDVPISEGRFNHFGQGHWYLGDSIDLCGAECSHKKNCVLWFQKVEIEQVHTAFKKGHWSVEKETFGAQKRTA